MTHENFSRTDEVATSSNRSFGLVMAGACTAFGLYPLVVDGRPHWWLLAPAGMFLLLGLVRPDILGPLNFLWTRLGLFLGKLVNPIVLGLMYYLVISPIALVMKMIGRDPMKRKFAPELETYWQDKDPAGPSPDSMRNQF